MKNFENIKNLLPLGYLYLVVLGVIKESIVFYQLGINIIKYSSVMDILLSPIAVITSHPLIIFTFLLFSVYPFFVARMFTKHSEKKWVRLAFGIKKNRLEMNEVEIEKYKNTLVIFMFVFIYLSLFLGMAFQQGYMTSQEIKNDQLKYKHEMYFVTGESQTVKIIDNNSEYFFYVAKGNKNINIIPKLSIKKIEMIENKMLNKKRD